MESKDESFTESKMTSSAPDDGKEGKDQVYITPDVGTDVCSGHLQYLQIIFNVIV